MEDAPAGTVAEQGITQDELRLAARNHGLPLEALRHPITPAGLHYLLIHYDIPAVDPESFRLEITGAVERPLTLSLDDLRARPRVAAADHLRMRRQRPRPAGAAPGQPAVADGGGGNGGVGRHAARAAARGGRRAADGGRASLQCPRPGRRRRRAAGVRTGDRGGCGSGRRPRLRDERRPAAPAARLPAAAGGARLVRDAEREVAHEDHRPRGAVRRLPERGRLPPLQRRRRARRARHPHAAALPDGPAGRAGLHDPHPLPRAGPGDPQRPRLVGPGTDEPVEVSTDGGATFNAAVSNHRSARTPGAAGASTGTPRPASTPSPRAPPTPPATRSRWIRRGTSRATRTTRWSGSPCTSPPRLAAPCASSAASSQPGGSISATTSGRSAASSRARSGAIRRSTASSTFTPRASPTTRRRCRTTCSTPPGC